MNMRLTVTAAMATIAASIALHPLISSATWFWEGVGAVAVVAGVASLTRLRPLPATVCLLVTAGGLLLYLNLVFSPGQSFGFVLPTPASLHGLLRLNSTGWEEAARFAPPVPGLRAISFLAVSGIGLAALFTDLLAVRLRKAAAAGVPLLALFSATVASKASAPSIEEAAIFSAGVAGYLALLAADGRDRIRAWGRLVSARTSRLRATAAQQARQGTSVPNTQALATASRRVGLAAVAAALLIPLLIPGLTVRDLFGSGPGGGGRGATSLTTLPDPLVQMDKQLHLSRTTTILTYRTDNPEPPYLRVYSLDLVLAAGIWTLSVQQETGLPHSGRLPPVPGLQGASYRLSHMTATVAHGVTGAIANGMRTQTFLPLPYPAVEVRPGSNGWAVDPATLMVWSSNPISGLTYTVTSKDVEPSAQQLRAAPPPAGPTPAQGLKVPAAYTSLAALAQQLTRGAATPYDKAVKLQQWFTAPGNFTYSLNASQPDTPAGIRAFLLHSRQGFCQQFAFAFAVLARLLGIPARVAVGYTAGSYDSTGRWRVTNSDAHAWPELYFQGAGWLPWEPTPAGTAPGQATAKAPLYTLPAIGGTGPSASPGSALPQTPPPSAAQAGAAGGNQAKRFIAEQGPGAAGAASHGHGPWLWLVTGLMIVVFALVLTPLTWRRLTRLWRLAVINRGAGAGSSRISSQAARARAAWLEIRDDLDDFKISCQPSESPRAIAQRVSSHLHLAQPPGEALRRIALAEERARYAAGFGELPDLYADVKLAHHGIAAAVSSRARWRARVFPASKASALWQGARRAVDVLGWLEIATSWLAARLRPGRTAQAASARVGGAA